VFELGDDDGATGDGAPGPEDVDPGVGTVVMLSVV
jgi:hypothetical protein